jgi:hypothetical protein
MNFIAIIAMAIVSITLSMRAQADCVFCQGNGVSVSSGNQITYRPLSSTEIITFCLMYEEGNSLHLLKTLLENSGKTLDDFYAQYHLIDCHESRMTPIYRLVMGGGNMMQDELQTELEYFRQMDANRRFEILNRVHVFHRRDRTERMRMTLLDQVIMFSRNTAQPEAFEVLRSSLVAMGAKRHADLTAEERERAPIRSRFLDQ